MNRRQLALEAADSATSAPPEAAALLPIGACVCGNKP